MVASIRSSAEMAVVEICMVSDVIQPWEISEE
jgi:hypothetical protein